MGANENHQLQQDNEAVTNLIRAISRVKKEADDMPVVFQSESRENIRFVFWMIGGAFSVLFAVVGAVLYVSSFTNLVSKHGERLDKVERRSEEAHDMAEDLHNQRSYGISHYQWYINKHGFPPNQQVPPPGTPTPRPGGG